MHMIVNETRLDTSSVFAYIVFQHRTCGLNFSKDGAHGSSKKFTKMGPLCPPNKGVTKNNGNGTVGKIW